MATFEGDAAEHEEAKEALITELQTVASTVNRVQSFNWNENDLLDQAGALFKPIEQAAIEADLAIEWAKARSQQQRVQTDVAAFLEEKLPEDFDTDELRDAEPKTVEEALDRAVAKGERLAEIEKYRERRADIESSIRARFRVDAVREAFSEAYDSSVESNVDEWYLGAFEAVADQYADPEEIDQRLNDIDSRIDDIEVKQEQLQERQADLNQELKELASEEDLLDARRRIQENSQNIERLGEKYATNRIAEYITEQLQERFIEETTGPLLEEASDIFARIIAEYDSVDHTGKLEDLDFQVLRDGEAVLDRTELSRATTEQLFMSVRLARIRQIETPLPVVLDDALTNFDPAHSARTISFLNELA